MEKTIDVSELNPTSLLYLLTPHCAHVIQEIVPNKYKNIGYLSTNDFLKSCYEMYIDSLPRESINDILPMNCFYYKKNHIGKDLFGITVPPLIREIQYFDGKQTIYYNLLFPELVFFTKLLRKINNDGEMNIISSPYSYLYFRNYTMLGHPISLGEKIIHLPLNNIHYTNDEKMNGSICWGDASFDYQKANAFTFNSYVLGLLNHFFNQPFNSELGLYHLGLNDLKMYIKQTEDAIADGDIKNFVEHPNITKQKAFFKQWESCKTLETVSKFLSSALGKYYYVDQMINKLEHN